MVKNTIAQNHPLVLIILDGWGCAKKSKYNAIAEARKPTFDRLWGHYLHTVLHASGKYAGLPSGQMGNSEAGHLNLGAGRIVYQDFTRISQSILRGDFFKNSVFIDSLKYCAKNKKSCHLLGLLSDGGVHSHEKHIHALIKLAHLQKVKKLYIHAFLDGRDTPPKSAKKYLKNLEKIIRQTKTGKIVSLIGRYYAMDRDKKWNRTQKAYDLLMQGMANYHAKTPMEGLAIAYQANETDEFVKPISIHQTNENPAIIEDGDCVIFMNFRADRARQLTETLTQTTFKGFQRGKTAKIHTFVCLTQYDQTFRLPIAFPPEKIIHTLGEVIAHHSLCQLRLAETEKYAHVTFFFNGGVETPFSKEERILVPSLNIATYDLQPKMSAPDITKQLVSAIKSLRYDVIICNYANCDMVGHTGNFKATVSAVEYIDRCLKKILSVVKKIKGELLITADHGNAEQMSDPKTKQIYTAHTNNPVPFIYVGKKAKIIRHHGSLRDVAPTVLRLLNLPIPKEMTGRPLIATQSTTNERS